MSYNNKLKYKCENKANIDKIKKENYYILNFSLHKVLAIDVIFCNSDADASNYSHNIVVLKIFVKSKSFCTYCRSEI